MSSATLHLPSSMLSVTVHPTNPITTDIIRIPVPDPKTLKPNEVLIQVHCAASNPKDWLHVVARNLHVNSGDDLSGIVVAVGSDAQLATRLKPGDRVAAFHRMFDAHGAYAEYSVAPGHTTFKIPPSMSFAEASTIPLVTTTAAITLFRRQKFIAPWDVASLTSTTSPTTTTTNNTTRARSANPNARPLLIYGASTSLGAFTIKLAKAAGIGPIIAIGGGSSAYVRSLLFLDDENTTTTTTSSGDAATTTHDVFLDYRSGWAQLTLDIGQITSSRHLTLRNAIDAYSAESSWVHISQLLSSSDSPQQPPAAGSAKSASLTTTTTTTSKSDPRPILSVFSGSHRYDEPSIPATVDIVYTYVGTAHDGAYKPGMPRQPVPRAHADADVDAEASVGISVGISVGDDGARDENDPSGDPEFARRLFIWLEQQQQLQQSLSDSVFTGHPYEIVPGGLHGVASGLQTLREGRAGRDGRKQVYQVIAGDTNTHTDTDTRTDADIDRS